MRRNVKCKYCEKVKISGMYQLKHHLARTSKNVGACITVLENVKKLMLDMVYMLQQNLIKKSISKEGLWDSSMDDLENAKRRLRREESEES